MRKIAKASDEAPSGRWAHVDSLCIATAMNPCVMYERNDKRQEIGE